MHKLDDVIKPSDGADPGDGIADPIAPAGTIPPENKDLGGAPANNSSAATHGLRMTLGRLPPKCGYIARQGDHVRLFLESALQEQGKARGAYEVSIITAICRHVRHQALVGRWLLKAKPDELTAGDRLRYSESSCRASVEVVKLISRLGLDRGADGHTYSVESIIHTPSPPAPQA